MELVVEESILSLRTRCLKCGCPNHCLKECVDKEVTYFNCGKQGHIAKSFTLPKREPPSVERSIKNSCSKTIGRVFALSGVEALEYKNLVQGMCFVNRFPFIVLFNCEVTHSFISYDCVLKLKLLVSSLKYKLVVEIPTNSSIATSNVCLQCPLNVLDRDFLVDLSTGYYSLHGLVIDQPCSYKCLDKTVVFRTPLVGKDERFITANQARYFC
ncbi:hypothetical protein CR513_49773, partial [Mucuna pruriens]